MASLAELAISLDTTNLKAGLIQLDELSRKSGASEVATAKLKKESSALAVQQAKLAATNAKLANTTQDNVSATMLAKQAREEHSVALAKSKASATAEKIAIDKLAATEKKAANDTAKLAAEQRGLAASMDKSGAAASATNGKVAKSTDNASKAAGNFAHQSRQVSMQLSQVAQQGSVTGNYLQALAIQLPDLALGFGTVGILVGALAGSLAIPLINALKGSTDAFDDLNESIREGEVAIEDLSEANKKLFTIDQEKQIRSTKDEIKDYKSELIELKASLKDQNDLLDGFTNKAEKSSFAAFGFASVIFEAESKIKSLNSEILTQTGLLDLETEKLKDQQDVLDGTSKAEQDRLDSIQDINESLIDQLAALTLNKSELLERRLIIEGATSAEIKSALAIHKSIEAEDDLIKKKKERDKLVKALSGVEQTLESPATKAKREFDAELAIIDASEAQKIKTLVGYGKLRELNKEALSEKLIAIEKKTQEQNNQMLSAGAKAGLSVIAGQLGQAAALAKEGGKEQFDQYKALAIGQAIISTALAVSNANAVPIIGPALAVTAGILGATQIGIIQNQEYQGARAMGGQVEAGGRFLVGENGPEVLQLGSQGGNVTPNHALGGGVGPSVTNVFNIQSGVTRDEVAGLIPTIVRATKQAVQSDMSKGGTMSQSIGRRA